MPSAKPQRAKRASANSGLAAVPLPPAGSTNGGAGGSLIGEVQRARVASAVFELAAARGAANVTASDVVSHAGVSRRTFYELYSGVEECLLAALEHALACARASLREAHDPSAPWLVQIRAGLAASLFFLEDQPTIGRFLVVDAPCAGPVALRRRAQALDRIVATIDRGREQGRSPATLSRMTAEGLAGGALSIVHTRMLAPDGRAEALGREGRAEALGRAESSSPDGRAESLADLYPPLVSMIVLPYLGPAAARRELQRALPPRERAAPRFGGAEGLSKLPMRLTYRTMRVLAAIDQQPGASNRKVGEAAGIHDQGQVSKLLRRLQGLRLIENQGALDVRGGANAWVLTEGGREIGRVTRVGG